MKSLPSDVTAYKRTDTFTCETTPKALLKDHQTKKDVWGKIIVLEGELTYKIGDSEVIKLTSSIFGVVEPQVLHHVVPKGGVQFYVEFYK